MSELRNDMIEAVIWDFGGVFTTSPFEAFARYERERGIPVGTIRKINSTNHENNAWAQFERSEVDIDGFDKLFAAEAKALGHRHSRPRRAAAAVGRLSPRVIEALRRVKRRVQDRLHHQQHADQHRAAAPPAPAARSMRARSWSCSTR